MGVHGKRWLVAAPIALGLLAGAAPAKAAGRSGPYLVDRYAVPAVDAGSTQWVKTWWSTGSDVCDVRVTVSGEDVTVTYPSNTGTYTSFYTSANLPRREFEYTAFKVTTDDGEAGWRTLKVDVGYVKLRNGTLPAPDQDVECDGRRRHRTDTVRLLVLPAGEAEAVSRPR